CLDCVDVCTATAGVISRQAEYDANVTQPLLEACAAICKSCGDECERHAHMHEHCRICAEACRRCERACRGLLDDIKYEDDTVATKVAWRVPARVQAGAVEGPAAPSQSSWRISAGSRRMRSSKVQLRPRSDARRWAWRRRARSSSLRTLRPLANRGCCIWC